MKAIQIFLTLVIMASLFSCKPAEIAIDPTLEAKAMPVKGRQGLQIGQVIRYGEFKTDKVRRGWTKSYDVPFVVRFRGAKEKLSFTQFGTDGQQAEVACISNFAVHRADLQRVLLAQIPDLPIHLNKRVWDFRSHDHGVDIRFADCSVVNTDYVIAADGIHSIFREMLLPTSKIRYAGYTCWRGVTPSQELPGYENLEGLNAKTASETWGLGKRFGLVPLIDGRIYWFACLNAPRAKDERLAAFGKKELLENFGDFHAPVAQAIGMTDPTKILWNDIIDFPPVNKFAFGRVLLLGDAAHATTPNMGQGACQAIEGAAILGKKLASIADLSAAFQAFEEVRPERTSSIVSRSWQLGKLAQLANPLLANLRNFALRLVPESMNERQVKALLDVEF